MECDSKKIKQRSYTDAETELMMMAKFFGIELGDERPDFRLLLDNVMIEFGKKYARLIREIEIDNFICSLNESEPGVKDFIYKIQQSICEMAGVPKYMLNNNRWDIRIRR